MKNNKINLIVFIFVASLHIAFLCLTVNKQNKQRIKPKKVKIVKLKKIKFTNTKPKKVFKPKPIKPISFNLNATDICFEDIIEEDFENYERLEDFVSFEETIIDTVVNNNILSKSQISQIKNKYINQIYNSIKITKKYPKMAKRLNQQGVAEVSFTINKNGCISNVKLYKSSGYSLIDKAAVKAVKKIINLKPIPKKLNKNKWEMVLPINYKLS